ncbi:hypothetical protein [Acetilactobacillus jinshanensis]|uniref:Uncharacterized protein n=1 Tax=Acetilactobacillus jinshanensis TaxID=1720083 RepID=A0A4V1ALQ5_9LACO|nr:hypothetical protein [Acetilactobacillus jinshanensis]QBP18419.1 hypothetical protein ELX58_04560 [Acetilactobacillus jinshanensis]URL61290.1 hypothetical protein HGK75_04660 [uncultured bacterium]
MAEQKAEKLIDIISRQILNYKKNNGYDSNLRNVLKATIKNFKHVTSEGKVNLKEDCYVSLDKHGIIIFHLAKDPKKGIADVSIINKVHIDRIKIGHILGPSLIVFLKDQVLNPFNKKLRFKIQTTSDDKSFLNRNAKRLPKILDSEHYVYDD